MTDHSLPADRQALLDYIAALLKNPEVDSERVHTAGSAFVQGLIGSNPQIGVAALADYTESKRKPKTRRSPSDGLYIKDIVDPLKTFLDQTEADWTVGLSVEEIRDGLFNRGAIKGYHTADHVQRVLVANQRHFQRLSDRNWRLSPNAKIGGSSDQRLLELKKKSKPDVDEHDSES
jgi:hypothetical protein